MSWSQAFSLANTAALVAWGLLILAPRRPLIQTLMRRGLIVALCLAYVALAFTYMFRVEGGGFGSLDAVGRLFRSEPVLLAGWLHYLAFDLFVGLSIAEACDAAGRPRLVQAPILLATFLLGPLGLLFSDALSLGERPSFIAQRSPT
jgi:hypothetical protein